MPPRRAGAASARELQQAFVVPKTPKLDLPAVREFLPSEETMNHMMSVDQFLTKSGLPTWDELGLPPISELMRPVGGARIGGGKLPSRAEVAKLANDTIAQVGGRRRC